MPRTNRTRSRYYVFTVNNPTGQIDSDALREGGCSYAIWSGEIGVSGTYHFQGYLEMVRSTYLTALKRIPGLETAHFEPRRGTQAQAIAYASKVDDPSFIDGPYTFGEPSVNHQGQRNDLARVQESITNGVPLRELATQHFGTYIRYHRGITEYMRLVQPSFEPPKYKPEEFNRPLLNLNKATLLWGPGGTGKTEFALAHFNKPLFVRHIDALREFSASFHDGIVFDDMDFSHWPHGSRVHILDMTRPAQIHCRYSHACIPAQTRRIFCSNSELILHKDSDTEAQRSAIRRRLEIIEIQAPLFGQAPNASNAPTVFSTFAEYTSHMRQQLVNLYTSASDYLGSDTSSPEPVFIDTGSFPTDLFP